MSTQSSKCHNIDIINNHRVIPTSPFLLALQNPSVVASLESGDLIIHQRFMFSAIPILHRGDVCVEYHNFPMRDTKERKRIYSSRGEQIHLFGCYPVWLCKISCERAFLHAHLINVSSL